MKPSRLSGLKLLLRKAISHILPGHGRPVFSGSKAIEAAYMADLCEMAGKVPQGPLSWMTCASAAVASRITGEALFCCDRALYDSPRDRDTLLLKASCLLDLKEYTRALDIFRFVEANLPRENKDTATLMGKGHALLGIGGYTEALRCFEKVLKTTPESREAKIFRAFSLYLLGRIDEALEQKEFRNEFLKRFESEMLHAMRPPGRRQREQR